MVAADPPDGRAGIDAALVRRLVATQFPRWAGLGVLPVDVDGWDNRTYRLGDELTVRLPTAPGYALAVDKEHRWLPVLAPSLPVTVPEIVGRGVPGEGYRFGWSIRRWLPGETARPDRVDDLPAFAEAVAGFIRALERVDATGGPRAGAHSFYRGAPLSHYDGETRHCLTALAARNERIDAGRIDAGRIGAGRIAAVWDTALSSTWPGPPVWFHGDIASGNLLVREGKLAAVIDFGTSGVGDPACDLVIAWTFFAGAGRTAFRDGLDHDRGTWARARGWALWKALLGLVAQVDTDRAAAAANLRLVEDLVLDHEAEG